MVNLRAIAGVFAGAGGLLSIYLGVEEGMPELVTGGLLLISSMMSFFVGEQNGARNAQTTS